MSRYILRRLIQFPLLVLVVLSVVFFILRLGPVSPVDMATSMVNDPAAVARIRHEFGVDQPIFRAYATYMLGVLHGDFGRSFFSDRPVMDVIGERVPATFELAVVGMVLGGVIGIGMGVVAALRHGTIVDALCRALAVAFYAIPSFWLGLIFIGFFTVKLDWLPATGRFDPRMDLATPTHFYLIDSILSGDPQAVLTTLRYLAMPASVLALSVAGFLTRLTRTMLLEALRQDYVRTARAKGLRERLVLARHALRNAILPVVTVMGLQFGYLLGGAAVIENVFAWPGLGQLMVDSINTRDYPQVEASIAVFAMGYLAVNLIVDVLYSVIDPRIRHEVIRN